MSAAFRCDRCDRYEDGNPTRLKLVEVSLGAESLLSVYDKDEDEHEVMDLCEKCAEDIQKAVRTVGL